MKLYILEPQPNIAPRLKTSREVLLVGGADSTCVDSTTLPENDFILVSGAFSSNDILRFLREQPPLASHTVIVEVDERPETILPFLELGAAGYVSRGASAGHMVSALHEIRSGKPPLAPPIGDALLDRMHELVALQKRRDTEMLAADCRALEALTLRERQVLGLIRDGATNQDIADQLVIELGTVKNHVHNILKKLNVTRREQAAQYITLVEQIG